MKLKTLKDLPICPHCRGSVQGNHKCVHFYELKAEAVKWVKFYRSVNWKRIAEEFMFRFNITEEDLK